MLDKLLNAKFRSRYSFNFLAIVGLLSLLYFSFIYAQLCYDFYIKNHSGGGDILVLMIFILFAISVIACIISILIYIIEQILNIRISNKKFLKSKVILFLQIIGVLSIISPGITIVLFLLEAYFLKFS